MQNRPVAPPAELEITDEKVFERLQESGLNLAEEALVGAFLYFPSEAPARRAATQIEASGFAAYTDPSPPSHWLVETEVKSVPTPEYIAEMGGRLRTIARAHGGLYDGWWAVELPDEDDTAAPPAPDMISLNPPVEEPANPFGAAEDPPPAGAAEDPLPAAAAEEPLPETPQ